MSNYTVYNGYPLTSSGSVGITTSSTLYVSTTNPWSVVHQQGVLLYAHNKILKIEAKGSGNWKVIGCETKWARPPL